MEEILKKKCDLCGKEITSMYEDQLEYNYNAHRLACEKKHKNKV